MITKWEAGGFVEAETPEWWGAEQDRIWPGGSLADGERPIIRLGSPVSPALDVYCLSEGRGYLVLLWLGDTVMGEVWCPTRSAVLDLMTTRAAPWMALEGPLPMEKLANAVVSYLRWGQGTHISQYDGTSSKEK